MPQAKVAPYGSWKSPITSDLIVAQITMLSDVRVAGGDVYWLESRPQEHGRNVIVRQGPHGAPTDIRSGSDRSCRLPIRYGRSAPNSGPTGVGRRFRVRQQLALWGHHFHHWRPVKNLMGATGYRLLKRLTCALIQEMPVRQGFSRMGERTKFVERCRARFRGQVLS